MNHRLLDSQGASLIVTVTFEERKKDGGSCSLVLMVRDVSSLIAVGSLYSPNGPPFRE